MKKHLNMLVVLAVLVLAILALPTGVSAEEAQMGVVPEAPRLYADIPTDFKQYVDEDAFEAYMIAKMQACVSEVDVSAFGIPCTDDFRYLTQAIYYVRNNNAELFHFNWIGPCWYNNGIYTTITITYHEYGDTVAEYNACLQEFYSVANRLLDGVKGNTWMTDEQKALILHDRLIQWTEYDLARLNDGTIPYMSYTGYGILVKQTGVCQGYALTYDYLLEQVGIRCEYVSSDLLNHAWNIVYINNKPYHVDTTWDDPTWDVTGRATHTNFLRSTNGMIETGHIVNGQIDYSSYPVDTKYDNYFWQCSTTGFQLLKGWIFYIDNTTQQIKYIDRAGNSIALIDVKDTWYASNGGYWLENYSKLSSNGTLLFYSSHDAVYAYDPWGEAGSLVKKVYTPSLSGANAIYGFKYENGYFICDITNYPNFDQYTKANGQVRYQYEKIYQDGWQLIDGKWYYYSGNQAKTGWHQEGKKWYFLNGNGQMVTGWLKIGNNWYFFNGSGVMQTGWHQEGSKRYYLKSDGAMATGTVTIDGKQNVFDASGVWKGLAQSQKNGWVQQSGKWYYYQNGVKKTGWLSVGGQWYFLNGNGQMLTGWQYVGGKCYYFHSNGAMFKGWLDFGYGTKYYLKNDGSLAIGWLKIGSSWYYFNQSGAMKTGWHQEGSKWYYLRSNGVMATGTITINGKQNKFDSSGVWLGEVQTNQNGWVQQNGKWYYYQNGAKKTGWLLQGGKYYYLGSDGAMKTGWLQTGGEWYYLGSDGVMRMQWQSIDNKLYYFDHNTGAMWHDTWLVTPDGYYYYSCSSGYIYRNGWYVIGGVSYYFDAEGRCSNHPWS